MNESKKFDLKFQITCRAIVKSSPCLYIYLFLISLIIIIITNVCVLLCFALFRFAHEFVSFNHIESESHDDFWINFWWSLSVGLIPFLVVWLLLGRCVRLQCYSVHMNEWKKTIWGNSRLINQTHDKPEFNVFHSNSFKFFFGFFFVDFGFYFILHVRQYKQSKNQRISKRKKEKKAKC